MGDPAALPGAQPKLIRQVQELEHKARRQDVLVDDELIHAFYDQQLPAEVCSGATLETLVPRRGQAPAQAAAADARRADAPRGGGHHHRVVPAHRAPGRHRLRASYLHEPGDAKDGVTVTVPIYALNQVSEERCEWLVPGMLKDKVLALVQEPAPAAALAAAAAADYADEFIAAHPFAQGGLLEVLLKAVRERTQLPVQRNDFKLEQLSPHLFMNFRVVDEHGRQLGAGRDLAG
jgi:ATP-dependent helicase HrpA